jgi:hypothetical protein
MQKVQQGNNHQCARFKVRLLASSWWLVGDGPSYLLFLAERNLVMYLTRRIPHTLCKALKGYQVITDGKLDLFVRHLLSINTTKEHVNRCKEAGNAVLRDIERLIFQTPEDKIFKGQLARFESQIKAARRFIMEHGVSEFQIVPDMERPGWWFLDRHGRELLLVYENGANPLFFRRADDSRIASCAQALWAQEKAERGAQATTLYRVPTRKELREYLGRDEPAVTKLCKAEGFDWLPRAVLGQAVENKSIRCLTGPKIPRR